MLLSRPPRKDYDNEEDTEIEEASHGDEDDGENEEGETDEGVNEEGENEENEEGEDVSRGKKLIKKGFINDQDDDIDGNGEGDCGNDDEVSKDVVNNEKKQNVDDDFFKGYSQLPVEDDDTVMAGLKVVDLASVVNVEESKPNIAVENFVNIDEITPPIERIIPKPGLHLQSPYAQQLSSPSKPVVVTSKVKGIYALEQSVVDDVNDEDEKAFDA
ncbi:hypothetical protein CsatB_008035 [Cannabis sativa]